VLGDTGIGWLPVEALARMSAEQLRTSFWQCWSR